MLVTGHIIKMKNSYLRKHPIKQKVSNGNVALAIILYLYVRCSCSLHNFIIITITDGNLNSKKVREH